MACGKFVLLIPLILTTAVIAEARTVRVALPELLGPQFVTSLETDRTFAIPPTAVIPISALPQRSEFVGFEYEGTIKAGRVVGDGIDRVPVEKILRGNFGSTLQAPGGYSYGFWPATLPEFGAFQSGWQLDSQPGGFIDYGCIDCVYPRPVWEVTLDLAPDFFALGISIPFFDPPSEGEFRLAQHGLILLETIEANITSASLVFNVVPEPACETLCLLGVTLFVRWRARRRQQSSRAPCKIRISPSQVASCN